MGIPHLVLTARRQVMGKAYTLQTPAPIAFPSDNLVIRIASSNWGLEILKYKDEQMIENHHVVQEKSPQ